MNRLVPLERYLLLFFLCVISKLLCRTYQTDKKYKETLKWHLYGIAFTALFFYTLF